MSKTTLGYAYVRPDARVTVGEYATLQPEILHKVKEKQDGFALRCPLGHPLEYVKEYTRKTHTVHAHGAHTVHAHGAHTVHAHGAHTVHAHGAHTVHAHGAHTVHARCTHGGRSRRSVSRSV
jgi:hypothetical protein